MKKDKNKYYGPYTSAGAVKDTIELIRKIYKVRTCNRRLPQDIGKERPCLNYHIKQCDAPCQGYISQEEYRRSLNGAMDFLNGNYGPILKMLEKRMLDASERMEYEEAATWRDPQKQRQPDRTEAEDHKQRRRGQRCDRRENGRQRRSSPGIFYQTGQADRQRPFLPADRTARFAEYRDFQFYEAVLFRHAVYSKGDHDRVRSKISPS